MTSCRYGAVLAGVDAKGVEAATAHGSKVGMAFQLSDDLIDLLADPDVSGKVCPAPICGRACTRFRCSTP